MVAAGFLSPEPVARGVTLWRERGLAVVDLVLERYLDALGRVADAHVHEHPFLLPEAPQRAVFGARANVFPATSPTGERHVLRPDNMVDNVALLRGAPVGDAVVALGGLLRRYDGPTRPLYREQYIWPAVQVSLLADRNRAEEVLHEQQAVLTAFVEGLGLPVLPLAPHDAQQYGRAALLSVVATGDGRPTVLSTAYVMSEEHRRALGTAHDVIDVGWTGKLLDVVVGVHLDARGVSLPSTIAPAQVVAVPPERGADPPPGWAAWLAAVRAAGLRVEARPPASRSRRAREEHRAFRSGACAVVGARAPDGSCVLARRSGERTRLPHLPPAADLRRVLADHDGWLAARAAHRSRGVLAAPTVAHCARCEREPAGSYGHVAVTGTACPGCGAPRLTSFISDGGRFY
jgi:hypothetical protein